MHVSSRTWSDRRPHAHKRDSMSTTCSHCRKRTATATGGAGLSGYCYPQLERCQSALCSGFSWELFTVLSPESLLVGTEIPDVGGGGGGEGGLYLTLHCHHHKDFCIRVGCDESCCNVLLIVSGKNHKKVSTDHKLRRAEDGNRTDVKLSALGLKPVLNWANVCSPNILRTVRRSMIRFLIELLVRRTWFRRFDELYFVLNWLVMSCKLRPELAADAQQTAWSKM